MFNWVQQRNRNAIFLRHRAANQATALLISFKMALLNTQKRVLLCNTIWTGKSNIVNVLLYKLLRWQRATVPVLTLHCPTHYPKTRTGIPFFCIVLVSVPLPLALSFSSCTPRPRAHLQFPKHHMVKSGGEVGGVRHSHACCGGVFVVCCTALSGSSCHWGTRCSLGLLWLVTSSPWQ